MARKAKEYKIGYHRNTQKQQNQSSENIVQTYLDNIAIAVLSKPEDVLGVDDQERVSLFLAEFLTKMFWNGS